MKIIRIFLLILIIVGIAALATQKLWMPKLVDRIIANENSKTVTIQPAVILKDGRQCYTYDHEATKDEPYAVNEFVDITIKGTSVTGTKRGMQNGPDMTNGYTGSITGTLKSNGIDDVFSYTIEGSKNKEQEIYRADETGIEKLRYPLLEKNNMLVPDTTKSFTVMKYARVGCTSSN